MLFFIYLLNLYLIFIFENSTRNANARDSPRTIVFPLTKAATLMRAIDPTPRRCGNETSREMRSCFFALPRSCRSLLLLARVHRERI